MREIKFRAWDNQEKEFLCDHENGQFSSVEIRHDGGFQIFQIVPDPSFNPSEDNPSGVYEIHEGEHIHLMQFTGLKDSKGVDIYEGDILRHDGWRENEDGVKILSDENRYDKYKVVEYQSTILFCGFNIPLDSEVIGNIYENPNLLEDIKGAA